MNLAQRLIGLYILVCGVAGAVYGYTHMAVLPTLGYKIASGFGGFFLGLAMGFASAGVAIFAVLAITVFLFAVYKLIFDPGFFDRHRSIDG